METLTPFIAYVAALGIAAVIPGPGIAALVGQALGGNQRASAFFLAGIALGDVTYLTIAVIGLAAIAKTFASAFLVIKVLGGLYLMYLAWGFLTTEAGLSKLRAERPKSSSGSFMAGYFVTLGNPKTIVFYLALLPTVMDLNKVHLFEWAMLAVLTVLVIFVALAPYAVLATKARSLMTQPKALRRLNRIAATAIGGAGTLILGEAITAALRRS
ncbi:MAG: LysE family translocator [Cognatishimia sp.]